MTDDHQQWVEHWYIAMPSQGPQQLNGASGGDVVATLVSKKLSPGAGMTLCMVMGGVTYVLIEKSVKGQRTLVWDDNKDPTYILREFVVQVADPGAHPSPSNARLKRRGIRSPPPTPKRPKT